MAPRRGRARRRAAHLFAAASIEAGIVNPLRILEGENGANQLAELGDPRTPEGFRSFLAMDPYVSVRDGVAYPAVLFCVGANDGQVASWMTGKMAARLRSASTGGRPVLVRVDDDAGHGSGSTRDQAYALRADIWAFFLSQCR